MAALTRQEITERIVKLIHNFVPYPYLYLLPCTLILVAYMAIVMLGFWTGGKISERKKQ